MYLKRLTCQGFKSFADKVDFDFGPGITGIVGPNGCGKSNVVDAIKWVLGDQSARSLRGKQMQDVIFNGSGTRKSSGMAQVDLVMDNSDRKLNLDTDTVTVSRRLFGSGESEYLINNEAVRLKDVRELFMDTGIGVGAYSIIEQGKVDVLLQANPQERRLIFEEAAGISRYKARKKEAQRKLARVEQNLLRIEDIIEEVEKRLRSIKYQAGKARNFQIYDKQLREKRAVYSLAEYHRLIQRKKELGEKSALLSDSVTELRTSISSAESRSSALDSDLIRLETEIQQIEQQILTNASEITANTERIDQSRQRIEELTSVRSRAQQRLAVERHRAMRLRQQIESEQSGIGELETQMEQARISVEEWTEQDCKLTQEQTSLQAQLEDEKAGIIDLLRRTTQLRNEIQSLDQHRERLEGEKGRLHARHEQVESELRGLLETKATIERQAEELAQLIKDQTARLEEKKQLAARLDADRAKLNQQLAAAKEYRSGLLSRQQLLLDLDKQMEGVDAGVRELLHRKEQDTLGQTFPYVLGMVADLVAADVANAKLIETALGEYDQYIVVEDSRAFFNDADILDEFPGRVNAICLDRLPPFIDGRDFTQQEGFVAYAMDLVRYPTEAEKLVRHLLGKTIIVKTFDDALRMAEQNPSTYRYVTLSGQLLDPEGLCQLGPAGARSGLISRKSELREIDTQIDEVDERISQMDERLEQASAEMAHVEQIQQELRTAIYEARTAEVENNAARSNNDSAIQRLTQEQPLIASEVQSVEVQINEATQRSSESSESLTRLEQANTEREDRIKRIEEQIASVNHDRNQLAEKLTEAKVNVGQLAQRRSMLADRLRSLREEQQASNEAVKSSDQEAQDAEHRITQTERTVLTAQSRLAELFMSKEQLDRDIRDRMHQREKIRYEMEQLAAQIKTNRTELTELEEKLHKLQMEAQETRIHVEDLTARVREELEIDLAQVYEDYQHQEQDWEALEAEINELKEKIRRLGNVNLDAIAEQEELEKRAEFLNRQHDDLRNSKKQLEELIEQLNTECRERFTQTFETVREHFQELFRKLFGGGKADVILEQPMDDQPLDVLEAGIDIHARPPGKEPRNISLLSGGEKTMTAIALLLAIFKSRPSPFAVLDEVDAALDEANNERFNHIVCEFLDKSQFVIITHSKRTMSIADILYGVTMQEAGVSKRVSVKFETEEEDETAAVA